ncbi:flippase [Streptococcus pneumoniae]
MEEKFKVKSIKYNFLMNIILKMSSVIFPLITFPYVSRVLLSEANGKIAFASSVVSYFSLVASLGIPSYGIRKCAEVRDDRSRLSKIVQELLIINTICTLLSYIVFIILMFTIPKFSEESTLFYITSVTILFNMLGVEWFYQAIEQYQYITVRNILFKIVSIILMFVFIHHPSDYVLYAGITVLASVGSNIMNIIRLTKYVDLNIQRNQTYEFAIHLLPIFTLFLYNATTVIFTSLDQVMLGFMKANDSVGYYAAAIKIKNILVSLVTALGAVMLPKVSYSLKNSSQSDFKRLITKSFEFIFISSIPISLFFIIMAGDIIQVLAGDTYAQSVPILHFLMPSIIFIGLSSVTAWQLLIPLGKEKYTVVGAIIGAVMNVVVNISLIPRLGAVGAAIASSLAELSVLCFHMKVLKSIIKETFELRELIIALLASSISGGIILVMNSYVYIGNSFVKCVIFGIVFFGIYLTILYICKEKLIFDFSKQIKGFVKGKFG